MWLLTVCSGAVSLYSLYSVAPSTKWDAIFPYPSFILCWFYIWVQCILVISTLPNFPFQVLLPPNTFPSQFHVFLSLFYSTKSYYCYPCVWASLEYGQLLRVKLPKKNDLPAPSSHFLIVSLQLGCNLVICPPTPHWCWLGLVSCIDNHSCWNFMCSVAMPCLESNIL